MLNVNISLRNKGCRLLFFLFTILLVGCHKDKTSSILEIGERDAIRIIKIDEVSSKWIAVDTLFENNSMTFIPLETTSKSLFGVADKIFLVDSSFIIYDDNLERIFEFNRQGNYVKNIGDYGKGPLEYNNVRGIIYNKYANSIDIMDVNRRLIQYDIISGKALGAFKLVFDEFSVDGFYPITKDSYMLYNNFRFDFETNNEILYRFAYSKNNSFLYKSLPYPYIPNKSVYPILPRDLFYTFQNKVRFFEPFNSVIYTVTNKGLASKYKIVYKSINNVENDLEKEVNKVLYPSTDKGSIRLSRVLESRRYLFLNYGESGKHSRLTYSRFALYDKETRQCLGNSINPFIIQELLLKLFLKQLSEELFAAVIPAFVVIKHQKLIEENLKPEEYTPLMKKLMRLEVKEMDNVVLMLMKLK